MKINVIGTGYVGLVSGVCLAAKGHVVRCFDTNSETIHTLRSGKCHFYEKGLEGLFREHNNNLSFEFLDVSSDLVLSDCEVILIAVGTPTVNEKIDLSQIKTASRNIGKMIKNHDHFISVIVKSTVVPGTTDSVVKEILEESSGKKIGEFGLGMNPEFLREGNAIEDFMSPDRIVFGHEDQKTLELLDEIYSPWDVEKIVVNTRTAEMIKYVNNSLLATQISTINEYSNIAESVGNIDFNSVMHAVHLDKRWTPIDSITSKRVYPGIIDYLKPGCGFGGSCFPKDVMALAALSKEIGINPIILDSVIKVNQSQPKVILEYLEKRVGSLKHKNILVLGISFKPETDDVRESVSIKIMRYLSDLGCNITAHDPISFENAKKIIDFEVNYVDDWRGVLSENDIIIVCTNWNEYRELKEFNGELDSKVLFDTRSLFKKEDFDKLKYININ
ncbi:UDP-glucose/GDP-mannose dehydrogenase family protein [bacterium]|nr:UDP-glucose/GDP-mannose dehydrogenase family protein [bacterium]